MLSSSHQLQCPGPAVCVCGGGGGFVTPPPSQKILVPPQFAPEGGVLSSGVVMCVLTALPLLPLSSGGRGGVSLSLVGKDPFQGLSPLSS